MLSARFRVANLLAAQVALLSFTGLVNLTEAAVTFVTPAAGSAIAGLTLDVSWADDGQFPLLTDLTTYKLFLCAGGNDGSSFTVVQPLTTTGVHTSGTRVQAVIPASVGASTPLNAYFIQMISDAAPGGTLTSFSTRFTLTDVTGKFTDVQLTGLKAIGVSTAGPQGQNNVVGAAKPGAAGDAVDESFFQLGWAEQTGVTKYAPMQPIPPNKITKKNPTPLFPTSAFDIAQTFLAPPPPAQTTITQVQTQTFAQKENPIAANHMPNDMKRFLNRWRD